jgi:hypothetical protein
MGAARVEIWNPANDTRLAEAYDLDAELNQRNIDDLPPTSSKLNDDGSGGIVLQEDHPAADVAVAGNVVRVLSDTEPVCAFTIKERDHTQIARVHRERVIELSGDGLLERFDHSTVDPWTPGRPVSIDRAWNFAAPRGFDDSGWSTTNYYQTRVAEPLWPVAYPVAPVFAAQLWTRPTASSQPIGSTLWRRPFSLDDEYDLAIFQAADDAANMWADGVLLNRHSIVWPDTSGWQKSWREVPPFSAGDHVAAFEAFNHGGPAFFMSTALTVLGGVAVDAVFSTGDDQWLWLDYPAEKPGFTAPAIMQMLLDEAHARLELLGWTIAVHGTHPNIPEFSVRIGTTYREVLDMFAASRCDIAADLEGLVLHMWPKGQIGTITSVDVPDSLINRLQRIDNDDICTSAQGVWAEGSKRVTRSAHPTLGVRSKSFQLGSYVDPDAVEQALELYLDAHEVPAPSIVAELEDIEGAVAGVDYKVGDTIDLAGTPVVVAGITWTVDQRTGDLIPNPEFESLVAVRRQEALRAIDQLSSQFESPATAALLTAQPLLLSGHPSTTEWEWTWADDIEDALNEIDPEKPWQIHRAETPQRFHKFSIEVDPDDLPDAWGTTKVQLLKNGAVINTLYDLSLTTTIARAEVLIWAFETITPADAIQVKAVEVGGHVDGTITAGLADPV